MPGADYWGPVDEYSYGRECFKRVQESNRQTEITSRLDEIERQQEEILEELEARRERCR
jgi:hypothetical protein